MTTLAFSLALSAVSFNASATAQAKPAAKDIVDTAAGNPSFKTLVAAVQAAGLVETLKGKGPFTVFAPTDDAFGKLPAGTVDALLKPENKHKLTAILTHHVVSGSVMAADVAKLKEATSVFGQKLALDTAKGVKVGSATVTATDIACTNGVIHVIDTVLIPQDIVEIAAGDGRFKTLVAALKAGELVDALKGTGPLTVFAPTDDAFAKLPKETLEALLKPENKAKLQAILKFHVVSGSVKAADAVKLKEAATLNGAAARIEVKDKEVFIAGAKVIITDIPALNGVIHVIDAVMIPPETR
ncbi:MAG: fasciclin domain-containing protein [Planctomycetes bacterium]|nr:fasciclin domain-containing protein [Planctomycetota bacterium]MCL4730703.1 fasciclin domain-containing protein [Planctomycetota bacterium]